MNKITGFRRIFSENKIEYFGVLNYSDTEEINSRLLGRIGFVPKSAIIFLLPYYTAEGKNLSCYATSIDYHIVIRKIAENIISALCELYPGYSFSAFGDHSPINEVSAALGLRLGILGDNRMLINEKYGSYVFIADILTDVPPEELGAIKPQSPKECEHCGRCAAACPGGALRKDGNCLSAITQKKGELTPEEQALMIREGTLWGCDVCSKACPHNENAAVSPIKDFYYDRIDELTPERYALLSDDEFSERAFAWRGREVVERNIRILFGGTKNG